ncbi:hypothetical protein [Celeribacter arenosi]|uniref:Uncharacterized protein n=1 Tax=Celeribacter arenosi TaxID=792649 RepID=A0ABP7KCL6_9RHOB
MMIAMHIGAHCTNGAQLMRGLLKNKAVLAENGVVIPGPARYRDILPDLMKKVGGSRATPDTQAMVIDNILDGQDCERVVLSYEDVICRAPVVLENGELYGKASFKLPWLRNVFADHDLHFFLGVRNPATFIPSTLDICGPNTNYENFVRDTDLTSLRWSKLVARMRDVCPDVPVTVYAYEDTPITWAQVIREVSDLDPMVPISGGLDVLATIMQREGMRRLRTYLHTHQPKNEKQRRQILSAFLDKYVDPEQIEEEIDLPGWDAPLVDALTVAYEDDLYTIEGMQGVRFIAP